MAKKKQGFQQAVNRLEEIARQIENTDTGLEASVLLYKEAVELSVFCNENLNAIEKEISVLRETANGSFVKKAYKPAKEERQHELQGHNG